MLTPQILVRKLDHLGTPRFLPLLLASNNVQRANHSFSINQRFSNPGLDWSGPGVNQLVERRGGRTGAARRGTASQGTQGFVLYLPRLFVPDPLKRTRAGSDFVVWPESFRPMVQ